MKADDSGIGKMNAADILLERGLSENSGRNSAILTEDVSVSYTDLDAAS